MNICEAAAKIIPGTAWNLRGDALEQAEDNTPRVQPPSMEAINSLMESVAYKDFRREEYPPITDQLDAIMKGGQALADMQANCMAVKAKFPKPE